MTQPRPVFDGLPRGPVPGLIATMNGTGFMSEWLDSCSQTFVDFAATTASDVLDIGCAYGVATLPALAGGARVTACDMESRHLEMLASRAPDIARDRLRTVVGQLPEIDFPEGAFAAILCARALHFLRGPDIEESVRRFVRWLKPGGKAFIVTDTPYSGYWRAHAPVYQARKLAGDLWPGYIADTAVYRPGAKRGGAEFLNPCDPDILSRVCREAGLVVEHAAFIARSKGPDCAPDITARDHAAVIACKADSAT